jgi:hypothetical protein
MSRPTAAAALAVLAATLLAACGGSSSTATTEAEMTTAAPATTAESTTTAERTTSTTTAAAAPQRISVVVRGGKIVGGGPVEAKIAEGTPVVLVVRADVSDEVHVHGYDLHGDVAPGKPARIAFKASIPGRFEAELESRGFTILRFEVS